MGMRRCVGKLWYRQGMASRANQRVLRWFGYVERMDEYRMARRVVMADVSGGLVQGLVEGRCEYKISADDSRMRMRIRILAPSLVLTVVRLRSSVALQ